MTSSRQGRWLPFAEHTDTAANGRVAGVPCFGRRDVAPSEIDEALARFGMTTFAGLSGIPRCNRTGHREPCPPKKWILPTPSAFGCPSLLRVPGTHPRQRLLASLNARHRPDAARRHEHPRALSRTGTGVTNADGRRMDGTGRGQPAWKANYLWAHKCENRGPALATGTPSRFGRGTGRAAWIWGAIVHRSARPPPAPPLQSPTTQYKPIPLLPSSSSPSLVHSTCSPLSFNMRTPTISRHSGNTPPSRARLMMYRIFHSRRTHPST